MLTGLATPAMTPFSNTRLRKDAPASGSTRRMFAVLCVALLWLAAPFASAGELSDADKMSIRDTIKAQLDAFKIDDAETAYGYAAPHIQKMTGTPAAFLKMVRASYDPVYRPRAVFFQDITMMDGVPAQRVLLMDRNGSPVLAVYPMERQDDGTWRIAGCMLYRGNARML